MHYSDFVTYIFSTFSCFPCYDCYFLNYFRSINNELNIFVLTWNLGIKKTVDVKATSFISNCYLLLMVSIFESFLLLNKNYEEMLTRTIINADFLNFFVELTNYWNDQDYRLHEFSVLYLIQFIFIYLTYLIQFIYWEEVNMGFLSKLI